jgi:hypothetical protein
MDRAGIGTTISGRNTDENSGLGRFVYRLLLGIIFWR